jgi:diguanylate cyclase (GGDEF)-like protein
MEVTHITPRQLMDVIDILKTVVAAGLDRDAVCQLIAERAMTLTEATGAVVELAQGEEMVYHKACGSAAHAVGLLLDRKSSLSGLCVEMRIPLKCDDAENDPRVDADACKRVGVASMVCVPLFHHEQAVGALKVLSSSKSAFTDSHTAMLALLASIIGSSMANAERFSQAQHESHHDQLTGMPNRRFYDQELQVEFARASRYGHPLTLALLDLDGFKTINDTQGHPAGDEVLRSVAEALRRSVRSIDRSFRLGGDEFAILLPETSLHAAAIVLERVSRAVAELSAGVGVSAGLAEARSFQRAEDFHAAADEQLYQVKSQRRQRESSGQ